MKKSLAGEIKHIIELLKDDDPITVSTAMSRILEVEHEAPTILAHLQEYPDASVRKAVHQMQVILRKRIYWKFFLNDKRIESLDLLSLLAEIHLLWFDNDSYSDLVSAWQDLMEEFLNVNAKNIYDVSAFMREAEFKTPCAGEIYPEDYCLGTILYDRTGADFMLSAIAVALGEASAVALKIAKTDAGFAIVDHYGKCSFPSTDWSVIKDFSGLGITYFDKKMLCRLCLSMLYLASLTSESFRCSYILQTCLLGKKEVDISKLMPYPIGKHQDGKSRKRSQRKR